MLLFLRLAPWNIVYNSLEEIDASLYLIEFCWETKSLSFHKWQSLFLSRVYIQWDIESSLTLNSTVIVVESFEFRRELHLHSSWELRLDDSVEAWRFRMQCLLLSSRLASWNMLLFKFKIKIAYNSSKEVDASLRVSQRVEQQRVNQRVN